MNKPSPSQVTTESNDIIIQAENLGKMYRMYVKPVDRLKQLLWGGFLDKPYGREFWAVQGISLAVRRGETVGIIGRNGCGKSTTLQMIAGTLTPTTGKITTTGRITALLELGSGFNMEYTGRENIRLYGSILGFSNDDIVKKMEPIIEFADIHKFIDQPLKTYSSGMAVRLAFSCAIHVDPDILIVDEALSVGDARFQQKCLRAIEGLREKTAVILVTHDVSALKNFCNSAIWIDQGQIRLTGTPDEVASAYLDNCYDTKNSAPTSLPLPKTSMPDAQAITALPTECAEKGSKAVIITHAGFVDEVGSPVYEPQPGTEVDYRMVIKNVTHVGPIIVGVTMTDRLGQEIFAINSLWTDTSSPMGSPDIGASKTYRLRFTLPPLNHGVYCLSPAVATGAQSSHEIMHWVHDATVITVIQTARRCLPGVLSLQNYHIEAMD